MTGHLMGVQRATGKQSLARRTRKPQPLLHFWALHSLRSVGCQHKGFFFFLRDLIMHA